MVFNPVASFLQILQPFMPAIVNFWWLWAFLILFFLARSLWLSYIQEYYKRFDMKYAMVELKFPREEKRGPRAMEQVFYTVHSCRNAAANFKEKWWDGEVTQWYSFETVSFGGEIHFYVRLPKKYRNVVEASFYAHYPDIEISEAEDYIDRLPSTYGELHKQGYELFGNELRLAKPDVFPIRTYIDFEEQVEERQLDPIASLLEVLNKLDTRENVLVQIIVRPADDTWREKGEEEVKRIKASNMVEFKKEGERTTFLMRTREEEHDLSTMERNISKPGFETLLRYVYIAKREVYSDTVPRRGVLGAYNQYASESLNKFAHNVKAWTRTNFWFWPHIFPRIRQRTRQGRIFYNYRIRWIYEELKSPVFAKIFKFKFFHWGFAAQRTGRMTLNTEELATIFHPPTNVVLTGPLIQRVEARKIGPPAGLPIYGGGEGEELPGVK